MCKQFATHFPRMKCKSFTFEVIQLIKFAWLQTVMMARLVECSPGMREIEVRSLVATDLTR